MGNQTVFNEMQRLDRERAEWLAGISSVRDLASGMSQMKFESAAATTIAQSIAAREAEQAVHIRNLMQPLEQLRESIRNNSVAKTLLAEFSGSSLFAGYLPALESAGSASAAQHVESYLGTHISALESARSMIAETGIATGLQQALKNYEAAHQHWEVPALLRDTIAPLQALHEQIGSLSFPVMDFSSAASLAQILGQQGIAAQLSALGISADGLLESDPSEPEQGIGLSRKSMELMTLLSLILAVFIPMYQEYSSDQWQEATEKKLETQTQLLIQQRNMIESLTKLVEKALIQEAQRAEERFVVRERMALVFSKPVSGASVVGKLFPCEVVRPVSETGKWIEIEYHHWFHQEKRIGWALKKYFQRVRPTVEPKPLVLSQEDQLAKPQVPLSQLLGRGNGCFNDAASVDSFIRAERDEWER